MVDIGDEGPLADARAVARMLQTVAADVPELAKLNGQPDDPFAVRDPAYIRETLPFWRDVARLYFRADVRGVERIPEEGPVLLVGNHSGGTIIVDTFVLAQALYERLGPGRRFHQLAHDLVFKTPGIRALLGRWGTVPASPENMARALELDSALLVYPGGDEETFRPSWEAGEVDLAGRTGFVELALDHGVPLIPVVAVGGQETAMFLGRGKGLARVLRLNQLARLKVLPIQIGPPFGLTVLDLPGRIPLPAKVTIRVMPPIDLRSELGPDPDVERGYRLVRGRMQRTLTRLQNQRTLPVLG